MKVRKSYRRVNVKDVCVESLADRALSCGEPGTAVGLDIAKKEIVVVIRWGNGEFERPWNVANPDEIGELIGLLQGVRETIDGGLPIGMESTGTYGEAIRHQLTLAKLDVQRVSGKAVSDYAEIFDGVPSQHDGKDAAIIAELTAIGKGTAWPFSELSETEQQMNRYVAGIDAYRKQTNMWLGRLEGLLARHWPELTDLLDLSSPTLLQLLMKYGSPCELLADPAASEQLLAWARGGLGAQKIEKILTSAKETHGVPVCRSEQEWIQEISRQALASYRQVQACECELKRLASSHKRIQQLQELGVVTMCVLWSQVGDPRNYSSARAYLKALGLNLKELSSGQRLGELAITKRGPSMARRWLFFLALRAIQRPEVKPWYEAKQARDRRHGKMKGLIAVMRKLCRSIWHVSQTGEAFDWSKVFPGRPLSTKQRSLIEA
jgi:transposase